MSATAASISNISEDSTMASIASSLFNPSNFIRSTTIVDNGEIVPPKSELPTLSSTDEPSTPSSNESPVIRFSPPVAVISPTTSSSNS